MRGGSFRDSFRMMRTMVRAQPHGPVPGQRRLRLAVLHGGGPAPGMNTAIRVAVRAGLDHGHDMLAVKTGSRASRRQFRRDGLDECVRLGSRGGAELGTSRSVARPEMPPPLSPSRWRRTSIDGLLMVGGWAGYQSAHALHARRTEYPALGDPDCVSARLDQQRPARIGAQHRRRHGAEQHRERRRQDQAVGSCARGAASSSR